MSRKRISFVAGLPGYNLFNRLSAIDSILASILVRLSSQYDIRVNGLPIDELEKPEISSEAITSLSKRNPISKWVPSAIKAKRRDQIQKAENDRLFELLQNQEKPDLVFELPKAGSDVASRISQHFGVPHLVYSDSPLAEQFQDISGNKVSEQVSNAEIDSIKNANLVIAYSPAMANYWAKQDPGIETSKFRFFQTLDYSRLMSKTTAENGDIPCIGFVGTFMRWHRVEMLVEAFIQLRKDGLDCRLLLVGAGEEYDKIRAQVETSSYKKDITTTGFLDGEALQTAKEQIDIGVMPSSNWYGIPTKVFEYGAMGVASLAPKTPTIEYVFNDGVDILLFDNNNSESLYNSLKRVLTESELRSTLGESIKRRIESDFSIEKAEAFYLQLINELIGE